LLGAGLIGCEFANDLRSACYEVDVVDLAPQPLGRLLPPQAAAYFRRRLEAGGVRFHLGTSVVRVDRAENGLTLLDREGGTWVTDIVLSAVGLRPETALASAAGLEVNRGIMVNRQLSASEPNVFAVGDCAEVDGLNLPYVMPIMQQARALAKTLSGTPTDVVYPAMPVAVKTPACPTVVCPPPMGLDGRWSENETADGVRALFEDAQGVLRGFALIGSAVTEKSALATRLPAMF
jgi:rubredoxin-NAD+ reductase